MHSFSCTSNIKIFSHPYLLKESKYKLIAGEKFNELKIIGEKSEYNYICNQIVNSTIDQDNFYSMYIQPNIHEFIHNKDLIEHTFFFSSPINMEKELIIEGPTHISQKQEFLGLYPRIFSDLKKAQVKNMKTAIILANSSKVFELSKGNFIELPMKYDSGKNINMLDCKQLTPYDGINIIKLANNNQKQITSIDISKFTKMYFIDFVYVENGVDYNKRIVFVDSKLFPLTEETSQKQKYSSINLDLPLTDNDTELYTTIIKILRTEKLNLNTDRNYVIGTRDHQVTQLIKTSFEKSGSIDFWYCLPDQIVSQDTLKGFKSSAKYIGKFECTSNDNTDELIITQNDKKEMNNSYNDTSNTTKQENNTIKEEINEPESPIKDFQVKSASITNDNVQSISDTASSINSVSNELHEQEDINTNELNIVHTDKENIKKENDEMKAVISSLHSTIAEQKKEINNLKKEVLIQSQANHEANVNLLNTKKIIDSLTEQTDQSLNKLPLYKTSKQICYGTNSMASALKRQKTKINNEIKTTPDFDTYMSTMGVTLTDQNKTGRNVRNNFDNMSEAQSDSVVEDCLVSLAIKEEEITKLRNELENLKNMIEPIKKAAEKADAYASELSFYKGLVLEKEDNLRTMETDLFNVSQNTQKKQERIIELEERNKLLEEELSNLHTKDLSTEFYQRKFYQSETKVKEISLSMRALEAENATLRDTIMSKNNQIASMSHQLSYLKTKHSVVLDMYSNSTKHELDNLTISNKLRSSSKNYNLTNYNSSSQFNADTFNNSLY